MTLAPLKLATATTNALIGVGAMIVVTIVGGVIVLRVRRAMLSEGSSDTQGLLLSDLRDMRARGEISEEEFERLRDAALRAHGVAPKEQAAPAPSIGGSGVDLTGEPLPGADGAHSDDDSDEDRTEPDERSG
jgi:hypothetical protein